MQSAGPRAAPLHSGRDRRPRFHNEAALSFLIYIAVSALIFGIPVLQDPFRWHVGYLADPAMMIWCLKWWPHALTHRINPFITRVVWAPGGYNLTWAASIPFVSLLFAPATLILGPVASYNLAALTGPALSAWAAFCLCRHLTADFRAALAGGLLYGFSPYEISHVLAGHLNLTFVFLLPLAVLLFLWLVGDRLTPKRFAAMLALLLTVQCLISTEILASLALFGGIALLVGLLTVPQARTPIACAILPSIAAIIGASMALSPFLYYALGPGAVPSTPIFPPGLFSADVLSFIVPTPLILVSTNWASGLGGKLVSDVNLLERTAYMSVPLLAIAAAYCWQRRKEAGSRFLMTALIAVMAASMGPVVHLGGRAIFTSPAALIWKLPLVKHALPIRFANYAYLLLAVILSRWLGVPGTRFKRVWAVAVLIFLLPNPALLLHCSSYETPPFFARKLYTQYLSPDRNVLIIPYGMNGPSMVWQAQSGMYFRMAGGYLGKIPEEFQDWPATNALLTGVPLAGPQRQLDAFLSAHEVTAIIVEKGYSGPGSRLAGHFGTPIRTGGVDLYRLPQLRGTDTSIELNNLQRDAARFWFAELSCAAAGYLKSDKDLSLLTPVLANEMGLLPDSRWGERLDLVIAGAHHGIFNGLWLGSYKGSVQIGMFTSEAAVQSLARTYGGAASGIFYPYPHRFAGGSSDKNRVAFLLMTIPVGHLPRCTNDRLTAGGAGKAQKSVPRGETRLAAGPG